MVFHQRVAAGVEAGLMAAAGVVLLFFFQDAVRLEPLATPEALATGLFGPGGYQYDTGLLASAAGAVGMGARLLSYTLLHFLAFAVVGVVAAFALVGTSWLGSLVGGALFGGTVCTAVFYASHWVMDAPVHLEAVGLPSVLVANVVAGVILGGGLFIARKPDPEQKG